VPVAFQIQCSADGFETFTVVASKNVSVEDMHRGVCIYTASKNGTCPSDVSLAPPQPFNMAADALDAAITNSNPTSIVRCLMADAERTTGRSLFRTNSAEYNSRVVAQGRHILSATGVSGNYSTPEDAVTARDCRGTIVKGVGGFLQCAIQKSAPASQVSLCAPGSTWCIRCTRFDLMHPMHQVRLGASDAPGST
jgi:hypothetical protein